MGSVK